MIGITNVLLMDQEGRINWQNVFRILSYYIFFYYFNYLIVLKLFKKVLE